MFYTSSKEDVVFEKIRWFNTELLDETVFPLKFYGASFEYGLFELLFRFSVLCCCNFKYYKFIFQIFLHVFFRIKIGNSF